VDWTFANNGNSYSIKTLQVLVRPLSDTSPPVVTSATVKDSYNVSVISTNRWPIAPLTRQLLLNGEWAFCQPRWIQ